MKLTHKDFDDLRLITVEEGRIDAASAIKFKDGIRNLTQAHRIVCCSIWLRSGFSTAPALGLLSPV